MSKVRVGVFRGGPGITYDESIKSGKQILESLSKDNYVPVDILVDKDEIWHIQGIPRSNDELGSLVDVAWNSILGTYGEDGKLHQILDAYSIPYVGSSSYASSVSLYKPLAKSVAKQAGFKVPYHQLVNKKDFSGLDASELFRRALLPVVAKLPNGNGSVGLSYAKDGEALRLALETLFQMNDEVMLEQFVRGREISVGVSEGFRGEDIYVFMPSWVRKDTEVLSYDDRISGLLNAVCPAPLSQNEKEIIEDSARKLFKIFGFRHHAVFDFIISPSGLYFIEADAQPALNEGEILPRGLSASGATTPQLIEHSISLALNRN